MKNTVVLGAALVLLLAGSAQAEAPPLVATLQCAPAAGPGRIVCELTAHSRVGKLVWSDALVVGAPAFARPLRARVVATDNPASGTASAKLALVAVSSGSGVLEVAARAVICRESAAGSRCTPEWVRVRAAVEVGQTAPGAGGEAP